MFIEDSSDEFFSLIISPSVKTLDDLVNNNCISLNNIYEFVSFLKTESFSIYFLNYLIDSLEKEMIVSNKMFFKTIFDQEYIFPFHTILNEKFIYYFDLESVECLSKFKHIYPIPNKNMIKANIQDRLEKLLYFFEKYWKKNKMQLIKLKNILEDETILESWGPKNSMFIIEKINNNLLKQSTLLDRRSRKEKTKKRHTFIYDEDETDNENYKADRDSPNVIIASRLLDIDELFNIDLKRKKNKEEDYQPFEDICKDIENLKI